MCVYNGIMNHENYFSQAESVCFGPGLSPYILYLTALLPPKYGETLKSILEDPGIPKCALDVRNDADALWALYNVGLASVTNI